MIERVNDEVDNGNLSADLLMICKEIERWQVHAKELGIFTNHRALAECADCQLFEDVTHLGTLYVYKNSEYDQDTGLYFEELEEGAVRCPGCKNIFCPYEPPLEFNDE